MKYTLNITTGKNSEITQECENLVLQNYYTKGGNLHYKNLTTNADYLIYVKTPKGQVVGFLNLVKQACFKNDITIMQVVVQKNHQNQGLANLMYSFCFSHSKEFGSIISITRNDNPKIMSLHKKFNMKYGVLKNKGELMFYLPTAIIPNNKPMPNLQDIKNIEIASYDSNTKTIEK